MKKQYLRMGRGGAMMAALLGIGALGWTTAQAADKSGTTSTPPAERGMGSVGEAVLTGGKKSGGPKLEGHKFIMPENTLRKPNTREAERTMEILTTSASIERGAQPIVSKDLPESEGVKERGQSITPVYYTGSVYRGLGEMFQYTNDGAPDRKRACGQAAIATILSHYNVKSRDTGYSLINEIYRRYGPDIAFGILGTSWQQMERALSGYGVPYSWYSNEASLKNRLDNYRPCIVMLDVGAMPDEGWGWGGHWVVAYGYDNANVYLTNWNPSSSGQWDGGKCSWTAFRKGWYGQLAIANGTHGKFICPKG